MSASNEFFEIVHGRHNEMIDPTMHIWGWEIPVYLFLGGLAAGLLVLLAILEMIRGRDPLPAAVRRMPFVALILLSLGMVALFLDLEYPLHVYRFYLSFEPTSPMSWGSWVLVLVYPAGLLLGMLLMTDGEKQALANSRVMPRRLVEGVLLWVERQRGIVLWGNIALGVALGTYTGLLLGTLGARPLWNTTILGPLFLASGMSTAAAVMLLFRPAGRVHQHLTRWDMILIGVELSLIALFLLTLVTGSRVAQLAAQQLLGGAWTGPFWALVVGLGLLVPLAMEVVEQRQHRQPTVMIPILILIGGFALRWILLVAGQASSFMSLH